MEREILRAEPSLFETEMCGGRGCGREVLIDCRLTNSFPPYRLSFYHYRYNSFAGFEAWVLTKGGIEGGSADRPVL